MLRIRLAGLLLAVVALTACSTGGGARHIVIPPASMAPATAADPADIDIPTIGAHSTLIPLGLNPDGSMQIPSLDTPLQAGFYARSGVKAGQPGPPLVVAAHVDAHKQLGLFARLKDLKPGDTARVTLKDGTVLTFRASSVESDPKNAFPAQKVFAPSDRPRLVLVTCGGSFDSTAHSYRSNILVYLDEV